MNSRHIAFHRLRFSIPAALLIFSLKTGAQDDLFITVSAPAAGRAAPAAETGLFTTVSSAQTQPAASPSAAPVEKSSEAALKKETTEKWEQELLRDPFWPVGYFPEGWQKRTSVQGDSNVDGLGWKAASGKIRISGTSRLGGRTVAIINGEMKSVGEQIEVVHEGKVYQWQIVGIDTRGQVQLKKQVIK